MHPLCPCWCPTLYWLAKRRVENRRKPVVAWRREKLLGKALVAMPRILLHCWRLWTRFGTHTLTVLPWGRWTELPRCLRRAWVSHQSTLPNTQGCCEVLRFDFPAIQLGSRLVLVTWLLFLAWSWFPRLPVQLPTLKFVQCIPIVEYIPNGKSVITEILYSSK